MRPDGRIFDLALTILRTASSFEARQRLRAEGGGS